MLKVAKQGLCWQQTSQAFFFLNAPLMRPRTLWACHSVAATGPLEQLNNLSRFAAPIFP